MLDQAGLVRRPGRAAAFAAAVSVSLFFAPALRAAPRRLAGELDAAGLRSLLAAEKGKVVLVNFWATWCVPCREEFPDLARIQKDLAFRGFRLVGISTDFSSQTSAVEKFLETMKPSFDNYRRKSGNDEQAFIDAVDKDWGGELPFSVIYDREGRKAKVLSGKHTYEEYRVEIGKVLGKSGP